jgi:hypothetical protein
MQGVTKKALQLYFKCYCVASVTKTFSLIGVQTIHCSRCWKRSFMAWVCKETIPTKRLPLVSEVSANFLRIVSRDQCNRSPLPYSRFLGRRNYYFFQAAPQVYLRGRVDPIPDPLLLRKSGSAGNRTWDLWICGQGLWPLGHRGSQLYYIMFDKN